MGLAQCSGGEVVESLDDIDDAVRLTIKVVISTLPASAEFELPGWMLPTKPIVFDVNYKPYDTKLLRQAEGVGCPVVRGSEMLWEQGVRQFELWTERTAPYKVMKQAVLQNCLPQEEEESKEEDEEE